VIIVFAFFLYSNNGESDEDLVNFYVPILIMAISDPIAAITGNWYTRNIQHQGKTLAGTSAFFVSAFIVAFCIIKLSSSANLSYAMSLSIILAFFTAVVERISIKGWDNFTVPLVAMAVLHVTELIK
jgi:dolichol kinase